LGAIHFILYPKLREDDLQYGKGQSKTCPLSKPENSDTVES
jgi:hypothetical protein